MPQAIKQSNRLPVLIIGFAATLLLGCIALTEARPSLFRRPLQDLTSIPMECMSAALTMQNDCSKEMDAMSEAFGLGDVSSGDFDKLKNANIDDKTLKEKLDGSAPPSSACCKATKQFNDNYCSCKPAVLDLVKSFTNGDLSQYKLIAESMQVGCEKIGSPYKFYFETTCPAK